MISSYNEYGPLKKIIVGTATHANWPVNDPVFKLESEKTTWKETPVPSGPVPQWIIDETEEDLQKLCQVLIEHGVEVVRPTTFNFQAHDGFYNYCPRDRFIVHGDKIIDPAMLYPCRDMEYQCYVDYLEQAGEILHMPRNQGMILDAANVLRVEKNKWLFLESPSGNKAAYHWLLANLPPDVGIELCNFYAGVHIDSTIVVLNEDTVIVNGSRVTHETLPLTLQGRKRLIFVNDVAEQGFYEYPYASKWIGLNMLSIDRNTVIVDSNQQDLIFVLGSIGFKVIPITLRHSRTLGGGFHCVTLDLVRGE